MTQKPSPSRFTLRNTTLALTVAAIGGFVGYQAIADTKPAQHVAASFKHGSWGGHHHAAITPEEIGKKVDRLVAHIAIEIEATDEQQSQIAEIAKAAALEMQPLRAAMREDAMKLKELLLADVVNPSEVEALRAARLADFDARSKVLTKAATDIAAILTPEQRRMAEERIAEFRGKRHGWRH